MIFDPYDLPLRSRLRIESTLLCCGFYGEADCDFYSLSPQARKAVILAILDAQPAGNLDIEAIFNSDFLEQTEAFVNALRTPKEE